MRDNRVDYLSIFKDRLMDALKKAPSREPWHDYYLLRAAEMESLFSVYKPEHAERALDIGSGVGFNAYLLGAFYKYIIATDLYSPDPKTHSLGMDKAVNFMRDVGEGGVDVLSSRAESLPFRDASFDAVFMNYTLEHVRRRDLAFTEIKRVLKDKGDLIIVVPSFMERFLYSFCFYADAVKEGVSYLIRRKASRKKNASLNDLAGNVPSRAGKDDKTVLETFKEKYPHFPFPEPHGEYNDYFHELFSSAAPLWIRLAKKNGFKVKKVFSTMLMPKGLISVFIGGFSLNLYLKTLKLNYKLGKAPVIKYFGQNLCLVLGKKDV